MIGFLIFQLSWDGLNQFSPVVLVVLGLTSIVLFLFIVGSVYYIPYKVYLDASEREMNGLLWAIFHFILFLSGFLPGVIFHIFYRLYRDPIGGKTEQVKREYHTFDHPDNVGEETGSEEEWDSQERGEAKSKKSEVDEAFEDWE